MEKSERGEHRRERERGGDSLCHMALGDIPCREVSVELPRNTEDGERRG